MQVHVRASRHPRVRVGAYGPPPPLAVIACVCGQRGGRVNLTWAIGRKVARTAAAFAREPAPVAPPAPRRRPSPSSVIAPAAAPPAKPHHPASPAAATVLTVPRRDVFLAQHLQRLFFFFRELLGRGHLDFPSVRDDGRLRFGFRGHDNLATTGSSSRRPRGGAKVLAVPWVDSPQARDERRGGALGGDTLHHQRTVLRHVLVVVRVLCDEFLKGKQVLSGGRQTNRHKR